MISVLSYGSGNVRAIVNIYKRLNIPCGIAECAKSLAGATKLILPGVGAFDQALKQLRSSGMAEELDRLVLEEKLPVLGVCVGMQIMADSSEEGQESGLGWISGTVRKIDAATLENKPYLPHMGWNSIEPSWEHQIFSNIDSKRGFYFLHSYHYECEDKNNVLAATHYGSEFASAIKRENIYGFQFHPEKSHANGVNLFKNFAEFK